MKYNEETRVFLETNIYHAWSNATAAAICCLPAVFSGSFDESGVPASFAFALAVFFLGACMHAAMLIGFLTTGNNPWKGKNRSPAAMLLKHFPGIFSGAYYLGFGYAFLAIGALAIFTQILISGGFALYPFVSIVMMVFPLYGIRRGHQIRKEISVKKQTHNRALHLDASGAQ